MMGTPSDKWPYGPYVAGITDGIGETKTNPETPKSPDRRASEMRLFQLLRLEDVSGMSGTGIVAEGVEFSDGLCVLKWITKVRCTAIYSNIRDLEVIHGHGGKTKVVWV